MNLDIIIAILAIIYLNFIINLKKKRKLQHFLSKNLNILLILILILLCYQINQNIGVIIFILMTFTIYLTKS